MERKRAVAGLLIGSAITAGCLLGTASSAAAEELREQLNAPMILRLLAPPAEAPDTALKETLKRDTAPALRGPAEWETLPDGSARHIGTGITVTVGYPCRPGDLEHEAAQLRALPGRSRR